ncbi:unnamed protein product [Protopolystoma xenopodis]|uniref:Uncharacterized protein n=1 Tax=Protopolystoma xenopodis TaxID=117903 RepID=A0A448WCD8_9PLAT|nr:unnamed protein product [Protopolystoma xenopodis]
MFEIGRTNACSSPPETMETRGLHQPERCIKAKRLQGNGNQPSSSVNLQASSTITDAFLPLEPNWEEREALLTNISGGISDLPPQLPSLYPALPTSYSNLLYGLIEKSAPMPHSGQNPAASNSSSLPHSNLSLGSSSTPTPEIRQTDLLQSSSASGQLLILAWDSLKHQTFWLVLHFPYLLSFIFFLFFMLFS